MIDPHDALRAYLIAASPLRTLLGGDFVFAPEVPATFTGLTMPEKAISFRVTGGLSNPYAKTQSARVTFRCWGTTSDEARDVYAALYDRLNGQQGLVVGSVAIHGADEDSPGEPLEDPDTGWPFIHTVYTVTLSTTSVA
jgi:hypothetical protein